MSNEFNGFKQNTFDFLRDLHANNNKDWFNANRERYEVCWLKPGLDFISAMEPVANALSAPHKAEARINGSLRRLYRDTRFSKDKTPYNPRMHIVFWCGDHPNRSPGIHIVLHRNHVGFGVGQWGLSPVQLEKYRRAIVNPTKRRSLLEALEQAEKCGCDLEPETLKRLPRGFDIDDEFEFLLKRKSLVARTLVERDIPAEITSEKCVEHVTRLMNELFAVNKWLMKHVNY